LTETVIDDRGDEFMRINGRYGGQAYRYVGGWAPNRITVVE